MLSSAWSVVGKVYEDDAVHIIPHIEFSNSSEDNFITRACLKELGGTARPRSDGMSVSTFRGTQVDCTELTTINLTIGGVTASLELKVLNDAVIGFGGYCMVLCPLMQAEFGITVGPGTNQYRTRELIIYQHLREDRLKQNKYDRITIPVDFPAAPTRAKSVEHVPKTDFTKYSQILIDEPAFMKAGYKKEDPLHFPLPKTAYDVTAAAQGLVDTTNLTAPYRELDKQLDELVGIGNAAKDARDLYVRDIKQLGRGKSGAFDGML